MSKVLIIDDENDICFLISEILEDESFSEDILFSADSASTGVIVFSISIPPSVVKVEFFIV